MWVLLVCNERMSHTSNGFGAGNSREFIVDPGGITNSIWSLTEVRKNAEGHVRSKPKLQRWQLNALLSWVSIERDRERKNTANMIRVWSTVLLVNNSETKRFLSFLFCRCKRAEQRTAPLYNTAISYIPMLNRSFTECGPYEKYARRHWYGKHTPHLHAYMMTDLQEQRVHLYVCGVFACVWVCSGAEGWGRKITALIIHIAETSKKATHARALTLRWNETKNKTKTKFRRF